MLNNGEETDSQREAEANLDAGNAAEEGPSDGEKKATKPLPRRIATPIAPAISDMRVTVKQRLVYFEKQLKKATSKSRHLERAQTSRTQEDRSSRKGRG